MINVQFILRACTDIPKVGLLYPYDIGSFKYILLYTLTINFFFKHFIIYLIILFWYNCVCDTFAFVRINNSVIYAIDV